MHPTRALLFCALCLFVLPVGGCDAIMSLLNKSDNSGSTTSDACEKAATCFEELDDEGADDELIEAYKKANNGQNPGWPNTSKSWPARSETECKAFMDFAAKNITDIKKAHPALNQTRCGGK